MPKITKGRTRLHPKPVRVEDAMDVDTQPLVPAFEKPAVREETFIVERVVKAAPSLSETLNLRDENVRAIPVLFKKIWSHSLLWPFSSQQQTIRELAGSRNALNVSDVTTIGCKVKTVHTSMYLQTSYFIPTFPELGTVYPKPNEQAAKKKKKKKNVGALAMDTIADVLPSVFEEEIEEQQQKMAPPVEPKKAKAVSQKARRKVA